MARKRMIDPEFFLDEDVCRLSAHGRLLYIGLWGICDDNYATLPNRPEWIKAQIFPYEDVSILELLAELSKIGKIILFEHEGKEYWYIKNFFKFQRVDRPSAPKYPPYPHPLDEDSVNTRPEVKLSKEKLSEVKLSERDTLSPLETSKSFFKGGTSYDEILNEFSEGRDQAFIEKEFKKFVIYWTEQNKSGTKERWELQPTFDVRRRLYTWLSRSSQFKSPSKVTRIIT